MTNTFKAKYVLNTVRIVRVRLSAGLYNSIVNSALQKTDNWPVLNQLKAGSLVGLVLDSGRSLHLYVGGKDQGVVAPDIPDPCYFMFDMWEHCQQVMFILCGFL